MSFDTIERSNFLGEPIALYEFRVGSVYWRYSSDEVDTVLPGNVEYNATAISDGGLVQSGDGQNNDVTITLPSNTEIAQVFSTSPPSEELWLTIRRKQREEDEAPVVWIGTVASSKQIGLRTTQFTCQMLSATFNRNGLRLSWGRQCPHALYDRNCRVDKTAFGVTMPIAALLGNVVQSAALASYPDRYFSNGFFEFVMTPGLVERRAIEHHVGDTFSILGTPEGLAVGATIIAYPGCARTTNECSVKFNNLGNYGGYPHLPTKSPFGGDPVF